MDFVCLRFYVTYACANMSGKKLEIKTTAKTEKMTLDKYFLKTSEK